MYRWDNAFKIWRNIFLFQKTHKSFRIRGNTEILRWGKLKQTHPLILLSVLVISSNPSIYSWCSCSYHFTMSVVHLAFFSHLDERWTNPTNCRHLSAISRITCRKYLGYVIWNVADQSCFFKHGVKAVQHFCRIYRNARGLSDNLLTESVRQFVNK
jgi:hypothetical protein